MNIDKFKTPDGDYLDAEGTTFDTAEDLLCNMVGYCGCGDPEAALKYLAKVLHYISIRFNIDPTESEKLESLLFPVPGSMWHTYYMLDDKELTEHGSSVPGWLTDKGREIMEDIQELYSVEP